MMKDLVVLVPDKNAQYALRGGLGRPKAMRIRPLSYEILVHPGRDGGVRTGGSELLSLKRGGFQHALLLLDFEGSGAGTKSPAELELDLDRSLQGTWGSNAKSIVLQPELDIWMWGSDNVLRDVYQWKEAEDLRAWLTGKGFCIRENLKPDRPKEALEAVCRHLGLPRSASLYEQVSGRISLDRCNDPAFRSLRAKLQEWFPPNV